MTARRVGIHLAVEVPDVDVQPIASAVVCGQTLVEVKEHGARGNGNWGAWWGSSCAVGGTTGFPYAEALAAAQEMAAETERRRLFHGALRDALAAPGGEQS